jgi:twinkle protein
VDHVKKSPEIIIVEGEMDKLALYEAGIHNVVSVPDGAPGEVKQGELPPPEADTRFQYLWNCRAVLDQAVRIVLATDGDGPGQVGTSNPAYTW